MKSTTSVVAVSHQTGDYPCSFTGNLCAIAVHCVKQRQLLIGISTCFRGHKRTDVSQCVKIPDTPAVVCAEAVHPGEELAGFSET